MIEYARRHSTIKLFTFDSTEFADGTRLRVYYSPLNIKREIIKSDEPRFRHSPCSCPACSSWDWTGPANTDMMDLHNLLMLDRRTRLASSYTDEALEEEIIDKIGFKKFCEYRDSLEQGYENIKHKAGSLSNWIVSGV